VVVLNYRPFMEDCFAIKNKHGEIVPFALNPVQSNYLTELETDYPEMQGIRENILKGRQFGISSVIEGLFATDFIMSELGEVPIINSDIYSHKDAETDAHIARFNLFLNSWLIKSQGGDPVRDMEHVGDIAKLRKAFLKVDNGGEIISRKRGAEYHAQTASAKVSGRGGTKQNIHWSEIAFYPNTEIMDAKKLVVGAEKQVPQNYGKIFRESTGNLAGDYFAKEYAEGKSGVSLFKSRFMAWFTYTDYQTPAPSGWEVPEYYRKLMEDGLATIHQCYWHFKQTKGLKDKEELREYPTYDREAFLFGGKPFFDAHALLYYTDMTRQPLAESMFIGALNV
jgi:hypothetical protein